MKLSLMQTVGLTAVMVVSTAMLLPPAKAADLGGDCCADLEERVAELEATTVRKGNRKVSLTLSGHVNQAILFSDTPSWTGLSNDPVIVDNENSESPAELHGQREDQWRLGCWVPHLDRHGQRDQRRPGTGRA